MAAFESAYPSLLQGVSQQVPHFRLPGQVEEQTNMLSDTVTGPRRRPGAQVRAIGDLAGASFTNVRAGYVELSGQPIHYAINTENGMVRLYDADFGLIANMQCDYLAAGAPPDFGPAPRGGCPPSG